MSKLLDFLRALVGLYPDVAPMVQDAIKKWGGASKAEKKQILLRIREDRFGEIDAKVDDMIEEAKRNGPKGKGRT